jgi:hypothetical protein
MAELLRILERTNTMSRAESTLVGPGADWLNCSRISTNHGHRFQSRATLCAFDPHLRKKSAIARFERSHFMRLFAPWILLAVYSIRRGSYSPAEWAEGVRRPSSREYSINHFSKMPTAGRKSCPWIIIRSILL